MHLKLLTKSLVCLAVASALTACGGGETSTPSATNTSAPASELDVAAATPAPAAGSDEALVGRVADGYIRGATVCLDINENGSCDADEPTATTGDGGLYELAMGDGAEGKPILADIPATAIDEDDNLPIGKRMMLSAPAAKREFISPITTLVHQELENNPAIDLDEAEASVKQELGLSIEDEDASLFADYVAQGDESDTGDKAERFRHMHRTAQVVAKMMQEIQDSAETAVVEQGVDLEGDPAARKALHKAVRKEIRKLLPAIAEAVSERIIEAREGAAAESTAADSEAFNASRLAEQFIPEEAIDAEKILIERDLPRVESVTVKAMLTEGFYWFDVDCSVSQYSDNSDGTADSELAVPTFDCAAGYTHIVLGDDGEHISQTDYAYDDVDGVWVAQEEFFEERDHVSHLVDGEWVSVSDNDDGAVEFTEDGGAIVEDNDGEMVIKAVERSLAGQHIARHLYEFDHRRPVSTRSDVLFPSDASEFLFKIKRKDSRYALFNWGGDIDGGCAEYNGNCNVVDQVTENGLQTVKSLDAVGDGIVLAGLLHNESNRSLNVALHAGDDEEGWGKAQWFATEDEGQQDMPHEMPECEPFVPAPDMDLELFKPDSDLQELPTEVDGELPLDALEEIEKELELLKLMQDETMDAIPAAIEQGICAQPSLVKILNDVDLDAEGLIKEFEENTDFNSKDFENPDFENPGFEGPDFENTDFENPDVDRADFDSTDVENTNSENGEDGVYEVPAYERGHSYGRWRTVEVDGVKMVELTVPFALRHQVDFDDTATVILIEHDGFLRRGAHFSNRSVESESAYNPVAFEALLIELEKKIGVENQ